MTSRRLTVRPNLGALEEQAEALLRAIHAGDSSAAAELVSLHPDPIEPASATLADAQLVLARSYQASCWGRLVQAASLAHAIWDDDLDIVRNLLRENPNLLNEDALIRPDSNWGRPMTYAANLGRDRLIRFLHGLGATDLEAAAGRADSRSRRP